LEDIGAVNDILNKLGAYQAAANFINETVKAWSQTETDRVRDVIDAALKDFVTYGHVTEDKRPAELCSQFLLKVARRQGGVDRPNPLSMMARAEEDSTFPDRIYERIQLHQRLQNS
jgi:hypothetical protein